MLRLLRSPSIYQLIYLSFIAVAAPFVLALGIALTKVGHLAALSRQDVLDAQQTSVDAQVLAERLNELERVALQYRVLRDDESQLVYRAGRDTFLSTVRATHSPTPELRNLVERIRRDEARVYELMPKDAPADQQLTLQLFSQLYGTVERLLAESQQLVFAYANSPPAAALGMQRRLIIQVAFVLPVAALLAALMMRIISGPIRHLEAAIRQLGRGELEAPINIDGPRDLADLGNRLDWLRLRLRELEAEKTSFLRNISHELKTPLTSIREGSDLLRQDYAGTDSTDQRQIVEILYENSLRLQLLIDNLLHFNRAAPAAAADFAPVQLDQLIARVLGEHRLALASKHIRVQTQLDSAVVRGSPAQLHSILDNLISNAVKFAPRQGNISISLRRIAKQGVAEQPGSEQVVVDVVDDGPGIDSRDGDRIFEMFYQGRPPADALVKGTGLGLAIAREFVALHQGHIEVVAVAQGAHLRVTLPLHIGQA